MQVCANCRAHSPAVHPRIYWSTKRRTQSGSSKPNQRKTLKEIGQRPIRVCLRLTDIPEIQANKGRGRTCYGNLTFPSIWNSDNMGLHACRTLTQSPTLVMLTCSETKREVATTFFPSAYNHPQTACLFQPSPKQDVLEPLRVQRSRYLGVSSLVSADAGTDVIETLAGVTLSRRVIKGGADVRHSHFLTSLTCTHTHAQHRPECPQKFAFPLESQSQQQATIWMTFVS